MISIVVPARRANKFIGQMLSSIYDSNPFRELSSPVEILVGVDGCQKTLDAVKPLMSRHRELRVFEFTGQNGPYLIRNTLAYTAGGTLLIFFDADDLMLPGLIAWAADHSDRACAIRFLFRTIYMDADRRARELCGRRGANGVFAIRKSSFVELGGFLAWPCSADSEFHLRCDKRFGPPVVSPQPLFIYRKHSGSLTVDPATNSTSRARRAYRCMVRRQRDDGIFKTTIAAKFATCVEVKR